MAIIREQPELRTKLRQACNQTLQLLDELDRLSPAELKAAAPYDAKLKEALFSIVRIHEGY